jgi:hypothetical protein
MADVANPLDVALDVAAPNDAGSLAKLLVLYLYPRVRAARMPVACFLSRALGVSERQWDIGPTGVCRRRRPVQS